MLDQCYMFITCVHAQDEKRLFEKEVLQRLEAQQEMMGRIAESQPQGEGKVPEKVKYVDHTTLHFFQPTVEIV